MQKKIKDPPTSSIKHKDLFWYYIVSSEINQNIAVEGLNASWCNDLNLIEPVSWERKKVLYAITLDMVSLFLTSAKSSDITNIF